MFDLPVFLTEVFRLNSTTLRHLGAEQKIEKTVIFSTTGKQLMGLSRDHSLNSTAKIKLSLQLIGQFFRNVLGYIASYYRSRANIRRCERKGAARAAEASGSVAKGNQNRTLPKKQYHPPPLNHSTARLPWL